MMYLYKIDSANVQNMPLNGGDDIDLKVFTPSIRNFFLTGEKFEIKKLSVRVMFQILTLGKAKIYYVQSGKEIVHTSYVIPACIKFPFMDKNGLEIGPCHTNPAFRGKGIYPKVLTEICRRKSKSTSSFYMIVDETNLPSIRGIEKAGFVRCGSVHKSKISKRYHLLAE